jgi:hypothetical protein
MVMVAMEKNAHQGYMTWTQFIAELYECFDTNTHHLDRLTKLKQSGTVEYFITSFEHLAFRMEGMSDVFFFFFGNALSVA